MATELGNNKNNNNTTNTTPSRFSFFNRSLTTNNNNFSSELSSSSSTLTTTSSRFSFFNRSLSALHNNNNTQKPPQPLESVKSIRGRVVQKLCNFFEPAKPIDSPSKRAFPEESLNPKDDSIIRLPGTEDRIVLYFTSLRGIRRTYEDCHAVKMIFRGFRVWVDERDISMDSSYRKELMSVLGKGKNVILPQVFIGGRYFGGVDVIKNLCEIGELGKVLEGFPRTKAGFVCESCGDVRFVPCGNCSGSRKVFDEDEGLMKRCVECNENGLKRCPNCCS